MSEETTYYNPYYQHVLIEIAEKLDNAIKRDGSTIGHLAYMLNIDEDTAEKMLNGSHNFDVKTLLWLEDLYRIKLLSDDLKPKSDISDKPSVHFRDVDYFKIDTDILITSYQKFLVLIKEPDLFKDEIVDLLQTVGSTDYSSNIAECDDFARKLYHTIYNFINDKTVDLRLLELRAAYNKMMAYYRSKYPE